MKQLQIPLWKEAPFIRILIPFCAGIVIQKYGQPDRQFWLLLFAAITFLWWSIAVLPLSRRYLFRWWYGWLLHFLLFASGGMLALVNDPIKRHDAAGTLYQPGNVLLVCLDENLVEKKSSYKSVARIKQIINGDQWIAASGRMLLYFQKDSFNTNLSYGDELILLASARPITNTGNPGSFDFVSYAHLQGISLQAFVRSQDYLLIANKKGNFLTAALLDWRENICDILKKYIPGAKESGLAEALLLGFKDDLDKDLVQAYSNTGVVHVIAISGLHLGLLYVICKWIFSVIPVLANRRWTSGFLIIIILWLFSLMTGASPSVLRSAVMFTAILTGESLSRKISMYNCLATAAFVLLCYKPYWLFDIGFQLSYSAVLSILIFMKPLNRLLYLENKILDGLWQMCSVTLSAQILTTPVSLFYFHQFPNYFLIANLVAIPLSSAVLIGEIALCTLIFIPMVASLVGQLLSISIRIMNQAVEHINSLPFSITPNIPVSINQLLFMYILVIATASWLMLKSRKGCIGALICLFAMTTERFLNECRYANQSWLIVYNLKENPVTAIIEGRKCLMMNTNNPGGNPGQNQHVDASNTYYGIRAMEANIIPKVISSATQTVYFYARPGDTVFTHTNKKKLLLVSGNQYLHSERVLQIIRPAAIVLDASHSYHSVAQWQQISQKFHIPLHAVAHKGAFVMQMN